ncbi:hypothetical protein SAMN05216369_2115 [Marinobacter antarcticus]|jgi:hypothetical protein|uniref:Uncharacterized protein n=1 Tax=Marinobacter antarcticus TaxID=564117 RepID=A0A1M6SLI1_9GAMM|nr:hypothetical protein [Marinobacter antarcticus]SHK45496.1 hypothetical protein SAMN05216369_2115 [Marinobacter antarcticus]
MEDISFQHVFSRVYNYLCEAGVEMASEQCRQMLQLIDDAVAEVGADQGGHRLLENAMNKLPDYFTVPEVQIPPAAPPLCRGSIGYSRRG